MSCAICNGSLGSEECVTISAKAAATLRNASASRKDGLEDKFQEGLVVHSKCRKNYTRPDSIKAAAKRLHSPSPPPGQECRPVLRSEVDLFDIKRHCLFCGDIACRDEEVKKKYGRDSVHEAATMKIKESVLAMAQSRGDSWGTEVQTRVIGAHDLVAAEARYHGKCHLKFFSGKQLHTVDSAPRGRPRLGNEDEQFKLLCEYLQESEECQFSIADLLARVNEKEEKFSRWTLQRNLIAHFGQRMNITELPGKASVVSMKETSDRILHDQWYSDRKRNECDERLRVVEAAAKIIREDIRSAVYDCDTYPNADESSLMDTSAVPATLQTLLANIISSKSQDETKIKRKHASIGQAIVTACRPRSSLVPILLGVGVWAHRRFASKELIDLLHNLGFSVSYQEVQRYEVSVIEAVPAVDDENTPGGNFIQHIFDNADFNIRTIDGHGTFHSMGGVQCSTPQYDNTRDMSVPRISKIPAAEQIAAKGKINIQWYRKPHRSGLSDTKIKDLGNNSVQSLSRAIAIDFLWTLGMWTAGGTTPSWNGYMATAMSHSRPCERSQIDALPFINLDPSNLSTLHTAMLYAVDICKKNGQQTCFITFDQPLYIKAAEIVASAEEASDLKSVVVRLGGFHLLMSAMGAIGNIMAGSGLEELWGQVYAKVSVTHMLTGHAYARALRAHFITQLALFLLLVSHLEDCSSADMEEVDKLYAGLMTGEVSVEDVIESDVLESLRATLEDICKELSGSSRTAALWLQYIRQVSLIRLFIRAERTADWELHLHCVKRMLPYLHAAGHLHYAKCAHLYVQEMQELQEKIPPEEYHKFTVQGYFSIRRSDKFWSGIWSDMIIEQQLMRAMKTSGGLTRGRGITESTLSQWILSLPGTLKMCDAVENVGGVTYSSSEQHVELRESRQSRDKQDVHKLVTWLKDHNPFNTDTDLLMSIATGVVADESVNCESAEEIGKISMSKMIGQDFGSLKLKRSGKVKTLAHLGPCVKIREELIPVDSNLLFMRISFVMKTQKDFEKYLQYELAPTPPSLFREAMMRKTDKSVIAHMLPSRAPSDDEELNTLLSTQRAVVVDGGMLLRTVVWPRPATYEQVFQSYVRYVCTHYNSKFSMVTARLPRKNKSSYAE